MLKLVESVTNISEGCDGNILSQLVKASNIYPGAKLLHMHQTCGVNRTVFTIAGEVEDVFSATYSLIRAACSLIDMTKQFGVHPRIGAVDVIPFVPLLNISIAEAVTKTEIFAKKISKDFSLPIYLYEHSAKAEYRKKLPDIRKGNYEKLAEKFQDPNWLPDIYPENFLETYKKLGASVLGVRDLLVAYNITLDTLNVKVVKKIAAELRKLPFCRAIGWQLNDTSAVQLSFNLINFKETGMHTVYEKSYELCQSEGIEVLGSELIGLVPKNALLEAGRYYHCKEADQSLSNTCSEIELLELAVERLGLSYHSNFDISERVLEEKLKSTFPEYQDLLDVIF